MINVICIDGVPKPWDDFPEVHLPENIPLQVYQSPYLQDCYKVVGYETINGEGVSWDKWRFVRTSEISETELAEQREQLQTV